jgi:hypothetical protein
MALPSPRTPYVGRRVRSAVRLEQEPVSFGAIGRAFAACELTHAVVACCREKIVVMADAGELKISAATRPVAEPIIARTDHVCRELLDDECADLAGHVVAKLARKRPSPVQSGRAPSWAAALLRQPDRRNA